VLAVMTSQCYQFRFVAERRGCGHAPFPMAAIDLTSPSPLMAHNAFNVTAIDANSGRSWFSPHASTKQITTTGTSAKVSRRSAGRQSPTAIRLPKWRNSDDSRVSVWTTIQTPSHQQTVQPVAGRVTSRYPPTESPRVVTGKHRVGDRHVTANRDGRRGSC